MRKDWHRKYTKDYLYNNHKPHYTKPYYRKPRKKVPGFLITIFMFGVMFTIVFLINTSVNVTGAGRKSQCQDAFDYVNDMRIDNGRQPIEWDDRLYELAVFRTKDMTKRHYYDHVTPEGTCAKDFKSQFNISNYENVAENAGGMMNYYGVILDTPTDVVDGWLGSRGHRYNLLYDGHTKGAVGCYMNYCIFYGLNNNPYGLGAGECTTGEDGLAFWKLTPRQPGEI